MDSELPDAGPTVVIDFQQTSCLFLPSVNKIGCNSFWNSTSNDDRWTSSAAPWTRLEWPTTGAHAELNVNRCVTGCPNGSGPDGVLDLLSRAPSGWATSRGVVLGVVLTGATAELVGGRAALLPR